MSRLAKKPITPGKTTVTVEGGTLTVKGSKATLTKRVHPVVKISVEADGITITPKDSSKLARALTGTFASHVKNMVQGVEQPFAKKLLRSRAQIKNRLVNLLQMFAALNHQSRTSVRGSGTTVR
jgi:ribosomal protein L6P/L9E